MLKFDEYLELPEEEQTASRKRLKTIQRECTAAANLSQWLSSEIASLTVIDCPATAAGVIRIWQGETVGFDIETMKTTDHPRAGLEPVISKIRLAQFFNMETGNAIIIDCQRAGTDWVRYLPGITLIIHNAQFEAGHLLRLSPAELDIECTMLAERVIDGAKPGGHSLADLALRYLGLEVSKALQTSNWARDQLHKEQLEYAIADAVIAARIWEKQQERLAEENSAYELFRSLIYPTAKQTPMHVDWYAHERWCGAWRNVITATRLELAALGLSDPDSIKQKQDWLMSNLSPLEIADWPMTEKGNALSTKREVLLENGDLVPAAKPLAEYTGAKHNLGIFGEGLVEAAIDGCLYPQYRVAGAHTGRYTCEKPNLQNIPRGGFKDLLLPPPGRIFVTGDLSQIELRVIAELADEEVMIDAFEQGTDLHRLIVCSMTGLQPADVDKKLRQLGKATNFGFIYGAGSKTVRKTAAGSYGVKLSQHEADDAQRAFRRTYPSIREWQEEIVRETNTWGFASSRHANIRRYFNGEVYTHAMNHPVQSTAFEVMALAIRCVHDHRPAGIDISGHVYDELLLSCYPDQKLEAALLLRDAFLHGFNAVFPTAPTRGLVEISWGTTWGDTAREENIIEEASI